MFSWKKKFYRLKDNFLFYFNDENYFKCEGIIFLSQSNILKKYDENLKKFVLEINYECSSLIFLFKLLKFKKLIIF